MKKIITLVLFLCLCIALLNFGGYTLESFSNSIHLRDPNEVLSPYSPNLNVANNTNSSNSSGGYTFDPNLKLGGGSNDTEPTSYTFDPDASIKPSGLESSSAPYDPDAKVTLPASDSSTDPSVEPSVEVEPSNEPDSNNESNSSETNNSESSNSEKPTYNGQITDSPEKQKLVVEFNRIFKINLDGKEWELTSNTTATFFKWLNNNYTEDSNITVDSEEKPDLSNADLSSLSLTGEEFQKIVNSINIVNSLNDDKTYDRSWFEKPVISYNLNGQKVNRNDYAWKTSKYYNEEDKTYTCPYTGKVITDLDDGKEDNDYGNLDYDHIVPLKSAYLRGAKDWTDEQKNAYAYDQSVGVDVLNSANRSKSDKGPAEYLPDINRGSYCYSWIVICQKYNLSMTQEELNICTEEINKAIANGETIEFMGGHYEN